MVCCGMLHVLRIRIQRFVMILSALVWNSNVMRFICYDMLWCQWCKNTCMFEVTVKCFNISFIAFKKKQFHSFSLLKCHEFKTEGYEIIESYQCHTWYPLFLCYTHVDNFRSNSHILPNLCSFHKSVNIQVHTCVCCILLLNIAQYFSK